MTIEIGEIQFRIAVGELPAARPAPGERDGNPALSPAVTEEIVEACVRNVLDTLRRFEGR